MNALIWVRQGKERLALANISGAMMIQATIPSALGLFFTSWMLSRELIVSGIITMVAVGMLLGLFSKNAVNARSRARRWQPLACRVRGPHCDSLSACAGR